MSSIIERPRRLISFAELLRRTGAREPFPADRLDEQISQLIDAITSTQDALAELRRDDGRLRNGLVDQDALAVDVGKQLAELGNEQLERLAAMARNVVQAGGAAVKETALYARDAESAAVSASKFLAATSEAQKLIEGARSEVRTATEQATAEATDAENWGTYSKAQADNAIAAKDEALQWAEYLAGPVVNASEAPAYIAGSPFPHGLYYQPVEGFGGVAGLWSSKWWAVYAAQLVGGWAFLYLGGWPYPPAAGMTNPYTGIRVPNPMLPGSIYYNTVEHKLYVWDGTTWRSPYLLDAGLVATYVYTATAGQKVFSGPDDNGQNPSAQLGSHPYDVHVNGVKLVANDDYTVDAGTATLTLADPCAAGSVVQWDVLVSREELQPGAVNAYKVATLVPDGTKTAFHLAHMVSGSPVDANVGSGVELFVCLDGVVQEPGVDFVAVGATLTMSEAPRADSRLWAVWYEPLGQTGTLAPVPPGVVAVTAVTITTTPFVIPATVRDVYFGAGSAAATLPDAALWATANPGADARLLLKDASGAAATNNKTITRAGSNTIDGASSFQIATNYGFFSLRVTPSSNWTFVG